MVFLDSFLAGDGEGDADGALGLSLGEDLEVLVSCAFAGGSSSSVASSSSGWAAGEDFFSP